MMYFFSFNMSIFGHTCVQYLRVTKPFFRGSASNDWISKWNEFVEVRRVKARFVIWDL